jgi:hypothetical protein
MPIQSFLAKNPLSPGENRNSPNSVLRRIGAQPPGAGKPNAATLLWAALLVLLACSGCHRTPPEQALRDTIAAMQKAGEEHRVSDLMDSVAEDFAGPDDMDRKQFRQYLTVVALRNVYVGTTLGPLDIQITGDRARVRFSLAARGGAGSWIPDRAQIYDVDTGWRREGDDWKLISATWKEKL